MVIIWVGPFLLQCRCLDSSFPPGHKLGGPILVFPYLWSILGVPPNYPLRYPLYQLPETIRPLTEVHWGVHSSIRPFIEVHGGVHNRGSEFLETPKSGLGPPEPQGPNPCFNFNINMYIYIYMYVCCLYIPIDVYIYIWYMDHNKPFSGSSSP